MSLLDKITEPYLRLRDGRKSQQILKSPELVAQFGDTRGQIETVLESTEFFHGTGRFHYAPNGSSKYSGASADKIKDTLVLLASEGLKPQEDLFSENFTGQEMNTVSLTQLRMYARVYASLFLQEGKSLQYEYGTQKFWWNYFLLKMILIAIKDKGERQREADVYKKIAQRDPETMERLLRRQRKEDAWSSTFRNDEKYHGRSGLTHSFKKNQLMGNGRSTIPGSHSLIIGIGKGNVQEVKITRPPVAAFEARTSQTLTPDMWSYIEVPLQQVDQTRKAVTKILGPDFPVFPTEFLELLMREKHLEELAAPC